MAPRNRYFTPFPAIRIHCQPPTVLPNPLQLSSFPSSLLPLLLTTTPSRPFVSLLFPFLFHFPLPLSPWSLSLRLWIYTCIIQCFGRLWVRIWTSYGPVSLNCSWASSWPSIPMRLLPSWSHLPPLMIYDVWIEMLLR